MRLWGHVWSVKLTVVLSPLLQWRSGTLWSTLCMRQQLHGHYCSFQPRIPLALFPCECYCSVLQCDGDGEGFCQLLFHYGTRHAILPGELHSVPLNVKYQRVQPCCTCHRKQSKGYQRSRHGEPFVYNSSWTDSSAARKTERVACVAWRFWLGALSNKGARTPGSTKPPCYAGYRTSDLLIVIKIKWVIVDKDDSENRQWHIKEHNQKHFKLTEHFE